MATVEVNRMLAAAAAACEDKMAEDIRILKLDPAESGLSDYFLICNGTNERQNVAITDEIELRLKRDFSTYPNSVEGRRQAEWILMDYVDFIVHVFSPEKRAFYGLERLRKSATTLSLDELDAEIKSAILSKRPAKERAAGAKSSSAAAKTTTARGAKTRPSAEAGSDEAAGEATARAKSASRKRAVRPAAGGASLPKTKGAAAKGARGGSSSGEAKTQG